MHPAPEKHLLTRRAAILGTIGAVAAAAVPPLGQAHDAIWIDEDLPIYGISPLQPAIQELSRMREIMQAMGLGPAPLKENA